MPKWVLAYLYLVLPGYGQTKCQSTDERVIVFQICMVFPESLSEAGVFVCRNQQGSLRGAKAEMGPGLFILSVVGMWASVLPEHR